MNDLSSIPIAEAAEPRPRARSRQDTIADELAESYLLSWAEWCRHKMTAQGYGGGVDMENGRMPRAPGTHGDPVLAEVLATSYDGQDRDQIVHDIVRRYTRTWRKVAWARWVGVQEPLPINEPSGWLEYKQKGRIQIAAGRPIEITVTGKMPIKWRWSGLQPWVVVAAQTKVPLRTCERIAAQIKRLIVLDVAAANRPGYKHRVDSAVANELRAVLKTGG